MSAVEQHHKTTYRDNVVMVAQQKKNPFMSAVTEGPVSGEAVRARVLARDVSVARQRPQETSVLNVLPVVLDSLQADRSTALLRLRVAAADPTAPPGRPVHLLSRITRRSADALQLQAGDALFAQIKGVALM